MIFKLKTSKKTMEYFTEIAKSENLQPYILSKLAISMSLKQTIRLDDDDFKTDNEGLELNRQTITGDFDSLFKCLIEEYEEKYISENEYVKKYLKAHLDRGARLIYREFRYGGDFLINLMSEDIRL